MADDWLEGEAGSHQREQHDKAIEFAQLYLVFEDNERGRALLAHMDEFCLNVRTPVSADIQQYVRDEAVRTFVAGIHQQIKLAQTRTA